MSTNVDALSSDIETKVKELNERINQQSGMVMQMNEAIKKFRTDRKNGLASIAQMQGAVQAFQECQKRLSPVPAEVPVAVANEVQS